MELDIINQQSEKQPRILPAERRTEGGTTIHVIRVKPRRPPTSRSLDLTGARLNWKRALPFLDIGNPQAANDGQYLCDNKVKYLVNLTGFFLKEHLIPRTKCNCKIPHECPTEEYVLFPEHCSPTELIPLFQEVNNVIMESRKHKDQRVLLFSSDGGSLCHLFAIQYMMSYYKTEQARAIHQLAVNTHVEVNLDIKSLDALAIWGIQVEEQAALQAALSARVLEEWPPLNGSNGANDINVGASTSKADQPGPSHADAPGPSRRIAWK